MCIRDRVGFALPFAFVIKPELLMLTVDNQPASILMIAIVVGLTIIAIVGLAASVAGYAFSKLGWPMRIALLACSLTIFLCRLRGNQIWIQALAAAIIAVAMILHYRLSAAKAATT